MVGLSGKPVGTKQEARARGGKASSGSPSPMTPFDALGAGRAPSNPFEQWISLFPAAPLFGVRWAFFDLMQNATSGLAPMFPMAAQCAAPASIAPFKAPKSFVTPPAVFAPSRPSDSQVSHEVESATLDSLGQKTAKHLRLVPVDEKPKAAVKPAEAALVETKKSEKKIAVAKPAAKKTVAKKAAEKKPGETKPVGTKPEAKKAGGAPRGLMRAAPASPDDLKLIKGVGAKLEAVLNDLGVYTYAQIAKFDDNDFDWLDERLGVSRGRPRRDDWVGQVKTLMASKKKG